MIRLPLLMVLVLWLLSSCKGTEEYLSDLSAATDNEARPNSAIYDSGLLIHESLTGLMEEEVLTLSQMGRAIWWCARILETNDVPLLRADAISLMTHITLRYPLPPRSKPYVDEKDVGQKALEKVQIIDEIGGPLLVEGHLNRLQNPDRTVAERALSQLREITGESFGFDPAPWKDWWAKNRDRLHSEAVQKTREPLVALGGYRYRNLSEARAVLGYLAIRIGVYDLPELRQEATEAVGGAARQALVFGIQRSLRDQDPVARSAAARAARDVLDPRLGAPLLDAFIQENDPDTKSLLIDALAFYPTQRNIGHLVNAVSDENRSVVLTVRRALSTLAGQDFGDDPEPWKKWWMDEGMHRWP